MKATITPNVLTYRLRRKRWDRPRRYTLAISHYQSVGGEEQSLQCCIPLTLIMAQFYSKSAVFRLFMRRPAFNGSNDYDKLQWVFARLMSISRQLHIRTRRTGEVWELLNESQILRQWPSVKKQIAEMYEDPLVEQILARQQMNLTHHLQSMYQQEPMMQLLFNDLFGDYTGETHPETKKIWPRHLGDTPFPFIERKQLSGVSAKNREAVIKIAGRPDPDRMDKKFMNRYLGQFTRHTSPAGAYRFNYEGKYLMDTSAGSIKEATLAVEGALGNAYAKKTNYHLRLADDR